ncbi:hypothetical protein JQK88_07340 [Mesorhizobium caraganae]|uniref:hypothetical protein n=1 Tax=Mesorhizobium caraganae TaxID=483206 RepID=UPI00193A35B7|nr:hypothetical protein [Mesorhizobium caraganae]MBM2711064.1 hypothetical protein [Mesorhizobium caraganae]
MKMILRGLIALTATMPMLGVSAYAQSAEDYLSQQSNMSYAMECWFRGSQILGVPSTNGRDDEEAWQFAADADGNLYVNGTRAQPGPKGKATIEENGTGVNSVVNVMMAYVQASAVGQPPELAAAGISMFISVMSNRPHERFAVFDFNNTKVSFADWDKLNKAFIGGVDIQCSEQGE